MTTPNQTEKLIAVSAIGTDRPGIVNELAEACAEHNGNIIDSRMTVLGGEFAVIMLVKCPGHQAETLIKHIEETAARFQLTIVIRETSERLPGQAVAYRVSVVALDNPGIVRDIASFFSERKINIEDMQTGTYSAPHTGTKMFSLNMQINIPINIKISELKDQFYDFCDQRNLDADVEAIR